VDGSSVNLDWDAVQKYIKEAKLNVDRSRPSNTPPAGIGRPDLTLPPVVIVAGGGRVPQPTFPNFNGGGAVQSTTTPALNMAAITSSGIVTSRSPTSVEELFSILNGLLAELRLTTLTPATVNLF